MTPANAVPATPAAVFPGTTATSPTAREFFAVLRSDLTVTRAIVDGARGIINMSEYTDGDGELCHLRTLLDECNERLEKTYTLIDESEGTVCRHNGAPPLVPSPSLASIEAPTALQNFASDICIRASSIRSVILGAVAMLQKGEEKDLTPKALFEIEEVLNEAAKLAQSLRSDSANATS